MTREQQIVEVFVELADTLVDDFDVVEFLHGVVQHCQTLLDCSEVGLLLVDAAGVLRVMASSSERAEALELLQSQHDEGPCYESFHRKAVVFSEDLPGDEDRWPMFAPAATRAGFRSVEAFPMRLREQTIGTLNLFRAQPGRISAPDLQLAQGLADIAAIGLLQERAIRESRGVVEQLHGALSSRVLIEQAKGVLAERAAISVDAAFARLRLYARTNNHRLSVIARQLIDGSLDPAALADLASAAPRTPR